MMMRRSIAIVCVASVLAGCAGVGTDSSAPVTSPRASRTPAVPSASPSGASDVLSAEFEVADGRKLHVVCEGQGSPTVILEAGDGSGTEEWTRVQPQLAAVTRTCAYDRGGVGLSDPATGCRQLEDLTADLEDLLQAASIGPPYVLVAGSGGGFIASGFAQRHAGDIAGVVFLDVPMAFLDPPPEVVEETACDHPQNRERRDYLQVEADAWESRGEIGEIPVTIISNDSGSDAPPEEQGNVEAQQGWLVLSPRAEQVVIDSGHDVAANDPELVVAEVTEAIEAARFGG